MKLVPLLAALGLGAGALLLPRAASRAAPALQKGAAPVDAEKTRERFVEAYARQQGLNEEELGRAKEMARRVRFENTPVVQALLDISRESKRKKRAGPPFGSSFAQALRRRTEAVRILLWGMVGMVLLGAALFALTGSRRLLRASAGFGSWLASLWLVWGSLAAGALLLFSGVDLWACLPADGQTAWVCLLLLGAGAGKLADMNAPVWNGLLRALGTPAAVSLLVMAAAAL